MAVDESISVYFDGDLVNFNGRSEHNEHKIIINKTDNGFIVKVGCKTFVKEKLKDLLKDLELYYTDPKKAYKKYNI